MSDIRPFSTDSWPRSLAERVDAVCLRFEAAWKVGECPGLEQFLADVAEPERSVLLGELLALELAYRRGRNEDPTPAGYERRFPEHAQVIAAVFSETATVRQDPQKTGVMDAETGLRESPTSESRRLQELADDFERAWQYAEPDAKSVDLRKFLPLPEDSLFVLALHRLIQLDLEMRWRRGQDVCLEHYLQQFPDLGAARTLPAKLIYQEYRIRLLYGDHPRRETYRARFPDQFAEFERVLAEQLKTTTPATQQVTLSRPLLTKDQASSSPPPEREECGYRLIKFIGRGGFGEVWQAQAPGGIPAAIKIILRDCNHEREAQTEQEALDTIKHLRHPFLLQTQAYWSLPDRLVIAMELADGSLRDRLRECRQTPAPGIPVEELLSYFRETADALDYLHSKKILHRDIKPHNLLLVEGHARVADFGLVRVLPTARSFSLMENGAGTPPYMAPEVWNSNVGKVSKYSDQYSLAATYAELRLDRLLFGSQLRRSCSGISTASPNWIRCLPRNRTCSAGRLPRHRNSAIPAAGNSCRRWSVQWPKPPD